MDIDNFFNNWKILNTLQKYKKFDFSIEIIFTPFMIKGDWLYSNNKLISKEIHNYLKTYTIQLLETR